MSQLTTRDYKKGSGRRGPGPGGLKEFLLGALAGALLAGGGTAFVLSHAARGHTTHGAPKCAATNTTAASQPSGAQGAQSSQSMASGAEDGAAQPNTPAQKYDFYRMLPNFTVSVPHTTASTPHPSHATATASEPGSYIVQVGSYSSTTEALHVAARLARLGVTARVEKLKQGGRTLNRVRIGPVAGGAALQRIRAQLASAGMHALVIPIGR